MGSRSRSFSWRLPQRLPPLRSWSWRIFLLTWMILLALGLYGTGRALPDDGFRPSPERDYGLFCRGDVVTMAFGPTAAATGIRPGDRILSINGRRPAPDAPSFRTIVLALGTPPTLNIETASPDGRRSSLRLLRSPDDFARGFKESGVSIKAGQVIILTMDLVSSLLVPWALALLLLLRRSRDPLAPWASLLMIGAPIAYGLAAHYYGDLAASDPLRIATNWSSSLLGWLSIAVLALYPDGSFKPRWTWGVLAVGVVASDWLWLDTPTLQSNIALLLGQFAAVAAVIARYRAMPPGPGRQQIRWTLFGFGASMASYAALVLVQVWFERTTIPATWAWLYISQTVLSCLLNLLLIVPMTIGLMRYRLYDADATISRSVAYGTLTLALLAIFAGSEKVIEVLGERYFGESLGALANGLGAAVAAAMIGPLHHRVTHWAERRFRSGLAQLREGLPVLVGDMRETASPAALADAMLVRVERGVRASHGAVIVDGQVLDVRDVATQAVETWIASGDAPVVGTSKLSCDRADPLFPMRIPLHAEGAGSVGWLLLGPRPDGSFYGREEREALSEIADPVARALAISLERERREQARTEREEGLHRDFSVLQRRLDALQRLVLGSELAVVRE